jgi:hypothetical protein
MTRMKTEENLTIGIGRRFGIPMSEWFKFSQVGIPSDGDFQLFSSLVAESKSGVVAMGKHGSGFCRRRKEFIHGALEFWINVCKECRIRVLNDVLAEHGGAHLHHRAFVPRKVEHHTKQNHCNEREDYLLLVHRFGGWPEANINSFSLPQSFNIPVHEFLERPAFVAEQDQRRIQNHWVSDSARAVESYHWASAQNVKHQQHGRRPDKDASVTALVGFVMLLVDCLWTRRISGHGESLVTRTCLPTGNTIV